MNIKTLEIQPPIFLAPMAGVADSAFRELCKGFGAGATVSEMISAKAICYNDKKTRKLLEFSENERPFGVQIFGSDPLIMAKAADYIATYTPDFIDINFGCPTPKITNNGEGSALMKNPRLIGEIVKEVVNAVSIPVTAKIRKGWDENSVNAVEVAKIAEQSGASAVFVHGRTRQQHYLPPVDYEIIKKVKQAVRVPVIANGDIKSRKDYLYVKELTNCDGVMIGRASLGNPFIFTEISGNDINITFKDRMETAKKHILKIIENKGEKSGILESRKHFSWYIKGIKNAAHYKDMAHKIKTKDEFLALVEMLMNLE